MTRGPHFPPLVNSVPLRKIFLRTRAALFQKLMNTPVSHGPHRNSGSQEVAVTQVCQLENCTGGQTHQVALSLSHVF